MFVCKQQYKCTDGRKTQGHARKNLNFQSVCYCAEKQFSDTVAVPITRWQGAFEAHACIHFMGNSLDKISKHENK